MRAPSWLISVLPWLLLAGLCAALPGCDRKAPGPEECQRFAELVVQLAGSGPLLTVEVQAEIEQETRTCLTQPYDRQLLDCVAVTHQNMACMAAYRRRTGRSL